MNKERHHRIETLFDRALEIEDPAGRDEFLAGACGADAGLRDEVDQLLRSYDTWTRGLKIPAAPALRWGPYECVGLLGRGGMGSVYRARRSDGEYQQDVAVKVLHASFIVERQILAGLNHPNIARLMDGGTTAEGEPYLVMELVDGEPIDVYCDTHSLPLSARLALFHQVLEAVDYAHRHLVVHRDLKPTNILVNRDGVVKLLDFGASKVIAEDATATRSPALTPGYASPEQLRGEPVATTTDVFSLGIVLSKLLTGREPFDVSYAASMERAFRGAAADLLVKGDLGYVLRTALAHDPGQRYPSVASFAEDLRRFSDRRPVLARRQDWAYVLGRGLRRHARAVVVASLVIVALTTATVISVRQSRTARREAARAQAANAFLVEMFELPVKDSATHSDLTVRELFQLAEARVGPLLGSDPAVAADVDFVLGGGFFWQGAAPKARALFERSLERARAANDIPRQAAAWARLGSVSYTLNQFDQAWKESMEALALWKSGPSAFSPHQAVGVLHDSATTLLYIRPHDPVHRPYMEEAIAIARRYPGEAPPSSLAACLQKLGESYINVDQRYQEALPLLTEAVALNRADPTRGDLLLTSLQSLGRVQRFLGRYAEDEQAQREAYELSARTNGATSAVTITARAIWAQSLLGVSRFEDAYRESCQALADRRAGIPVPGSPLLWTCVSVAANAACLTRRYGECEGLAREAIQTLGERPEPGDVRFVDARAIFGLSLAGQGRLEESRPVIEQTIKWNAERKRRPVYSSALESFR